MDPLKEILEIVGQIEQNRRTSILDYYRPYPFQREFHNAVGYQTQKPASQRVLLAANQVGKTHCGAMETAIHATGRYPAWWKDARFVRPVEILVGSKTNDSAKKVAQNELFGDPLDDSKLGTGTIPLDCIVRAKITRKPGVPNAIQDALAPHETDGVFDGYSKITIMAYEQKAVAFMGMRVDIGWPDEEPPIEIWSQFIRATISRRDAVLYITFTPEEGMTEVVTQFMNDLRVGQALVRATWDDATHISADEKEQRLAALPPHEREMRSRGIPQFGSGLVFPVMDDDILIEPREVPSYWPQIIGIDFGYDHPFAAARLAWDRESDCIYLCSEYRETKQTPPIHAAAVKPWGNWIPVVWPHDGMSHDKGSGIPLAEQYRGYDLNLLRDPFSNPPPLGQKEGAGGNGVEVGVMEMLTRMQTNRFKVFNTCRQWMDEKRIYHRQDGKLVKIRDDIISASRYAVMSMRHARTKTIRMPQRHIAIGARNW